MSELMKNPYPAKSFEERLLNTLSNFKYGMDYDNPRFLQRKHVKSWAEVIQQDIDANIIGSDHLHIDLPNTFRGDGKPHTEIGLENKLRQSQRLALYGHQDKENTK